MLKKFFSHTVIYGVAPQVIKLANFFALPIITKDLTLVDYGVSGVLTAYVTGISVFASLGLRTMLVNSFYKSSSQYKWLWRQLYGFLMIWNWVYAFALSALIYFIIPQEAQADKWIIIFLNAGPIIFFGPTQTIGSTYYQVKQEPYQIAVRTAIFGISTVLLNIYFISVLKMGYMGWFWSNFIVGVATSSSYWYPVNYKIRMSPIFNFKWKTIRNALRISLPTVPHFYSNYLLNTSDRMVMDVLKIPTADIGRYNAAYTVSGIMSSVGNASGLAIGPMLNKLYKEGRDELGKDLIMMLQLIFFLISFPIAIWMKELFQFLIRNDELAKMYPLAIIIVMAYNYRPMYVGANAKLLYSEKTNVLWKVTLVAGLINLILNFTLLPFWGYEVAAFTTFVALMYMGYAGFYYKVFREISSVEYHPFLWLMATIVLTALAYWVVEADFWIKLVITALFASVGLWLGFRLNKKMNGLQSQK